MKRRWNQKTRRMKKPKSWRYELSVNVFTRDTHLVLQERLKKEYKNANKQREGYIDESDEEDMEDVLTGAGKNIQKTLRKLEKDGGYDDDSDDEKNPYASSVRPRIFPYMNIFSLFIRRKRKRKRYPRFRLVQPLYPHHLAPAHSLPHNPQPMVHH